MSPQAGWYADADREGGQRFWDGSGWTDHRIPHAADAPPAYYPSPDGSAAWLYWNGSAWTQPDAGATAVASGDYSARERHGAKEVSGESPGVERTHIPWLGARGRARELADEVEELRAQLDRLGAWSFV